MVSPDSLLESHCRPDPSGGISKTARSGVAGTSCLILQRPIGMVSPGSQYGIPRLA